MLVAATDCRQTARSVSRPALAARVARNDLYRDLRDAARRTAPPGDPAVAARAQIRPPHASGGDARGHLPDLPNIRLRPPAAHERLMPGHWEGDLIVGAHNRSAIGVLVCRRTLYVKLVKLEDATARTVLEAFGSAFEGVTPQLRQTLTYDQGKEMALHRQLSERTGLSIYFADPHSPWQRGICENTNGLLRQYFPKGTDLSVHSAQRLKEVAWEMNNRPRRSLGVRSPVEVLYEELKTLQAQGDALGT
ncbi:IS30 family transposase [Lysobacter enzymogenes]|uniref:IS30 family transposase n=1 Tax=Lysobacter enzymogenes TaxID=69 RepID=UPI002263E705|nr:IS30 family transposase [Lysobacter enzymogenes]UZW59090.1 IS30 family transposase [Lysobacter enzymogenes]